MRVMDNKDLVLGWHSLFNLLCPQVSHSMTCQAVSDHCLHRKEWRTSTLECMHDISNYNTISLQLNQERELYRNCSSSEQKEMRNENKSSAAETSLWIQLQLACNARCSQWWWLESCVIISISYWFISDRIQIYRHHFSKHTLTCHANNPNDRWTNRHVIIKRYFSNITPYQYNNFCLPRREWWWNGIWKRQEAVEKVCYIYLYQCNWSSGRKLNQR